MPRTLLVASFVALSVTACASMESHARSEFSRENTCPADRVTVSHAPPRPAPPDVAADADRLAMWNDKEARRAEHYYVASGCGRQRTYLCERRFGEDEALPNCLLQQ